jgi:hypothetical protein
VTILGRSAGVLQEGYFVQRLVGSVSPLIDDSDVRFDHPSVALKHDSPPVSGLHHGRQLILEKCSEDEPIALVGEVSDSWTAARHLLKPFNTRDESILGPTASFRSDCSSIQWLTG